MINVPQSWRTAFIQALDVNALIWYTYLSENYPEVPAINESLERPTPEKKKRTSLPRCKGPRRLTGARAGGIAAGARASGSRGAISWLRELAPPPRLAGALSSEYRSALGCCCVARASDPAAPTREFGLYGLVVYAPWVDILHKLCVGFDAFFLVLLRRGSHLDWEV